MKITSESIQLSPRQGLDNYKVVEHGSLEYRLKQLLREYVEAGCCPRSAALNIKEWISDWAESTDIPIACEDCHDESECDDCTCPMCYPEDIQSDDELDESV